MIPGYDYGVQTSNTAITLLFFHYYVHIKLMISSEKQELHLLVVIILFKTEFGHAQNSVTKISKPKLKTACINPWAIVFKCVFNFLFFIIKT